MAENYFDKIEVLLNQAEAAFELSQDSILTPAERDAAWQRASYRMSLAQGYSMLEQARSTRLAANALPAEMGKAS